MQCTIMENTIIKLTLHDETKKMAHDSQIVRAKENLKLRHKEGSLYLACNENHTIVLLLNNLQDLNCGHVRKFVTLSIIFCIICL